MLRQPSKCSATAMLLAIAGCFQSFALLQLCQHKLNPAPPDPLLCSALYLSLTKRGEILPEAFSLLRCYLPGVDEYVVVEDE